MHTLNPAAHADDHRRHLETLAAGHRVRAAAGAPGVTTSLRRRAGWALVQAGWRLASAGGGTPVPHGHHPAGAGL